MTKLYEDAVEFLLDCIEYAEDSDLERIDMEGAASQVDGYTETFGDELPEILRDPRSFMICWNTAIRKEIVRRYGDARPIEEAGDRKLTLILQDYPLQGDLKLYRSNDGTVFVDYIGRWPYC